MPEIYVEDGTTTTGIDGKLVEATTISGTIQRTDGTPASYYAIVVERNTVNGPEVVRGNIYTDELGQYEVLGLVAGDYTLRFLPPYSSVAHLRLYVTVEAGTSISGQNGVAGPDVPTNLATIAEPEAEQQQMSAFLYLPFMAR